MHLDNNCLFLRFGVAFELRIVEGEGFPLFSSPRSLGLEQCFRKRQPRKRARRAESVAGTLPITQGMRAAWTLSEVEQVEILEGAVLPSACPEVRDGSFWGGASRAREKNLEKEKKLILLRRTCGRRADDRTGERAALRGSEA